MTELGAIVAILLAAGQSRRFGTDDKLMAELRGVPLAVHAARVLIDFASGRLIAICADCDGPLARRFAALGFEAVPNLLPDHGISNSVRLGINAARSGREQAALLMLADMPFVTSVHLRSMLDRFDPGTAPVVGSSMRGVAMPPALFDRSRFDELEQLHGDMGGRALLASAVLVAAPAGELTDIDRPGQLPPD
ncbi:nucleotidyltransferase family protein [Sphingobium lactosutens]|uniref:nucleotidyltransferase family protein n=1 Tax=Sphingobium lactosutens TaxID=522773 RepID=UPI0015BB2CF2|nr:nucleotidyltransferase family protein [Sphingobium lactosutens]NWK98414.1 nucleotidyltransferase family protein [Sphingobium lactosutens]